METKEIGVGVIFVQRAAQYKVVMKERDMEYIIIGIWKKGGKY